MIEDLEKKEIIYPTPKKDRRLMSKSRPDYSDRRSATRYIGNFPVRIFIGEGKNSKVYHAIAKDVSDGGLLLENIDVPTDEERIRIDFKIPEGIMPEEYIHGKYELYGKIVGKSHDKLNIAFEKPLSHRLAKYTWKLLVGAALLGIFLTVTLIILIKIENIYFFWFDVPIFLYSLTVGFYLISRFVFASFYKPPKKQDYLPFVTIVIPAYNEEKVIEDTLIHAMEIAYPRDKFQVIAVNDGSTDKTLEIMKRVQEKYPELIIVDFGENRGKRKALATGARMAKGEIVVFTDSDSMMAPDAIRNIVDGFLDPEVAAITGHCDVANAWTNLLTKMQAVRYFIGFRVLKGAESIFNSVTCLSGPLSAYRRDILLKVLDKWVTQTYLGRPATFGDDRSLTNYLLKDYKILYDSRARTSTIVPEKYKKFFKQQMRWKRSWFRESLRGAGFMWRKQPLMSISFYLGFILPILGPAIVFRAMIYVPLLKSGSPLHYIIGIFLMSSLMSTTYLLAKKSRLWIYGIPFCFFYMFVLVWQLPWAMLTFWRTTWGTRREGI